jgi:hypothetical protein
VGRRFDTRISKVFVDLAAQCCFRAREYPRVIREVRQFKFAPSCQGMIYPHHEASAVSEKHFLRQTFPLAEFW